MQRKINLNLIDESNKMHVAFFVAIIVYVTEFSDKRDLYSMILYAHFQ